MIALYDYFRSSACYRVRIALHYKGVAYEQRPIHLVRDGGQQRSAAYKARNPQGLIPALELEDGTVIGQSLAILEYLEAVYPSPALIPADPVMAAKVRAVALGIACDIHPLNNLRVFDYLKGPLKASEDDVKAWHAHWSLKGGLEIVEQMIEGGDTCFGDAPTLADVMLIPQVFNARRFNVDISHLPKILRVDTACSALPAFAAAHPAQQLDAE